MTGERSRLHDSRLRSIATGHRGTSPACPGRSRHRVGKRLESRKIAGAHGRGDDINESEEVGAVPNTVPTPHIEALFAVESAAVAEGCKSPETSNY